MDKKITYFVVAGAIIILCLFYNLKNTKVINENAKELNENNIIAEDNQMQNQINENIENDTETTEDDVIVVALDNKKEVVENVEEKTKENKVVQNQTKENKPKDTQKAQNTTKNDNTNKINTVTENSKTTLKEDAFENGRLKKYPSFGEVYATLKISKINVNTPIYFGLTDALLLKGVCHDSGSYFSGESGSIVLAGHNYMNGFSKLGNLNNGDKIEIKTQYGDFFYKIYDKKVINETDVDKISIQNEKEILMIYTCYPLKSTRHTNQRYVIYAKKI